MTAVDTEIEVFLDIDFDKEVVCEYKKGCDSAAKWKIIHNCCGYQVLYCDKHKKALDAFMLKTRTNQCIPCGHLDVKVMWVKL